MAATATVVTRPLDRRTAVTAPATSICAISQPPKMSPLGLVSAGMGTVRMAGSPWGRVSLVVMMPSPPFTECCRTLHHPIGVLGSPERHGRPLSKPCPDARRLLGQGHRGLGGAGAGAPPPGHVY